MTAQPLPASLVRRVGAIVYDALAVTTNPIPVKAALEMTGLIPCGALRLPLVPANEGQRATVRAALESVGLNPVAN